MGTSKQIYIYTEAHIHKHTSVPCKAGLYWNIPNFNSVYGTTLAY